MAFLRIVQNRDAFRQLPDDAARDAVIGRHRDGTRLDLPGVDPTREPVDPAPNLPAGSHVRKAAPRSRHDDLQIFRRGLPFMETADGQQRVGLQFASFQASLDQFDTMLNDWMLSPNFPADGAGPDALLDPARGLTKMDTIGIYFVPPHDERHLGATLFDRPPARVRQGRLAVRKRVIESADPSRRFERAGFVFRVLDPSAQQVGEPFTTSSNGRAVFAGRLPLGLTHTLEEVFRATCDCFARAGLFQDDTTQPAAANREHGVPAESALWRVGPH